MKHEIPMRRVVLTCAVGILLVMVTHGVESADSVVSDLSSTEESFTFTGPVKVRFLIDQ